jgi:uncharacterized membrane protein SpoIIM required for sporulation
MKDAYYLMILIDDLKEAFNLKEAIKALIRYRKLILFCSAIFILSFLVLYVLMFNIKPLVHFGDMLFNEFKRQIESYGISKNSPFYELIIGILKNNLKVCIINYILGIFSLYTLVANAYILSYVMYENGIYSFVLLIIPHGIFEIPALILSSVGGILLHIGIFNLILNIRFKKDREFRRYLKDSVKILILSIILFIIAATIEGTITFEIAKMLG